MIDPLDYPKHLGATKLLNLDCRDGKHPPAGQVCDGWDLEADTFCPCPCPCHYPPKDGHE